MALVDRIVQVSVVDVCDTRSVCRTVCAPRRVKSSGVIHWAPLSTPVLSLWQPHTALCVHAFQCASPVLVKPRGPELFLSDSTQREILKAIDVVTAGRVSILGESTEVSELLALNHSCGVG